MGNRINISDYIGVKYGKLTILGLSEVCKKRGTIVYCICDCGKNKTIPLGEIKGGKQKTCGCGRRNDTDYVGFKNNKLVVLSTFKDKHIFAKCMCECGNAKTIRVEDVISGKYKSCGCSNHKLSKTPEYDTWSHLKSRCLNKTNPSYASYGGRGIEVCKRWMSDFTVFYNDMGPKPSPKHSIDRIDVNGDYEPSNCRWADIKTQARNKRNTLYITKEGKRVSFADYCEENKLNYKVTHKKLKKGQTI